MLTVLVCAVLSAPMPGDAETAAFKAAFERGEELYQQGEYGAAIYHFKQADRMRATPEVAYDLAKAHEKLEDTAFTLYYYRLYMRRAPNAPDTLEVAERVGEALARAEADGRGFLELDAPRASDLHLGDAEFPEGPVAMLLPPGEYQVKASFPAGEKTMQVQIRTGKTASILFEPVRPPLISVEAALSPEMIAKGLTAPPSAGPSGLRVGSYVTAGVGVAALVVGALMGGMSASDAERSRDLSLTVGEAQTLADSANGKAVGANILMGAGGAAVAGGAVMFVFSMPEPGMKQTGGGGR